MADPNHADIQAQAALCNPDTEPERAIDLNTRLIQTDPTHSPAWFRMCRAYHALGLLNMALEACDRAIALGNTPTIARRKRIEADPRNTAQKITAFTDTMERGRQAALVVVYYREALARSPTDDETQRIRLERGNAEARHHSTDQNAALLPLPSPYLISERRI